MDLLQSGMCAPISGQALTTASDRNLQLRMIFCTGLLNFLRSPVPCIIQQEITPSVEEIARIPGGENPQTHHVSGCYDFFSVPTIYSCLSLFTLRICSCQAPYRRGADAMPSFVAVPLQREGKSLRFSRRISLCFWWLVLLS